MTDGGSSLLAFVRAPRSGEVKTRLAADIGPRRALAVYRTLVQSVVRELRNVDDVQREIHFTPADAEEELRRWLGEDLGYLAQHGATLGDRLRNAFEHAFARGARRVVVVGSDVPALRAEHLTDALARLESVEAVLGPALDGGYYLIGLRRPLPSIFHGIDWSTDRVLSQTTERLEAEGVSPALLEPLTDVDRASDLPLGWRRDVVSGTFE